MRLITYDVEGTFCPAVLASGRALDLRRLIQGTGLAATVVGVRDLLWAGTAALATVAELAADGSRRDEADAGAVDQLRLGPPILDPQKIVCVGLNYHDHALETGLAIPQVPMLFAKYPSSLMGPADAIVRPPETGQLDYEAELAVVIGRTASRVAAEDARSHLAGAMSFNDVSARDCQFETTQVMAGKTFDTFAPSGPALVTLDEIPDLQALSVRTWVDGEIVQDGTTSEMIFSVAELVSFASHRMTLVPGDLLCTGTPAGVGLARQRFLRPGQRVDVEIGDLGRLSNPVVDAS